MNQTWFFLQTIVSNLLYVYYKYKLDKRLLISKHVKYTHFQFIWKKC